MTTPMSRAEMIELLRAQADEIAAEGHNGWGNTMLAAADMLRAENEAGAVAVVPVHPKHGPLWANTVAVGSQGDMPTHYPVMQLYAHPPTPAPSQEAEPVAWMCVSPGCVCGPTEGLFESAIDKARNMPAGTAVVPVYAHPPTPAHDEAAEREAFETWWEKDAPVSQRVFKDAVRDCWSAALVWVRGRSGK